MFVRGFPRRNSYDFSINDAVMPLNANRLPMKPELNELESKFDEILDVFLQQLLTEILFGSESNSVFNVAFASRALFRRILVHTLQCGTDAMHRLFETHDPDRGPPIPDLQTVHVFGNVYIYWYLLVDVVADLRHGGLFENQYTSAHIFFLRLIHFPEEVTHPILAVRSVNMRHIQSGAIVRNHVLEPNFWFRDG